MRNLIWRFLKIWLVLYQFIHLIQIQLERRKAYRSSSKFDQSKTRILCSTQLSRAEGLIFSISPMIPLGLEYIKVCFKYWTRVEILRVKRSSLFHKIKCVFNKTFSVLPAVFGVSRLQVKNVKFVLIYNCITICHSNR